MQFPTASIFFYFVLTVQFTSIFCASCTLAAGSRGLIRLMFNPFGCIVSGLAFFHRMAHNVGGGVSLLVLAGVDAYYQLVHSFMEGCKWQHSSLILSFSSIRWKGTFGNETLPLIYSLLLHVRFRGDTRQGTCCILSPYLPVFKRTNWFFIIL